MGYKEEARRYVEHSKQLEEKNKVLRHEIVGWVNWTYYLPKDYVPTGLIKSSKKVLKENA